MSISPLYYMDVPQELSFLYKIIAQETLIYLLQLILPF